LNLKKIGNVFTSKFVGTGPSPFKKRIFRAAVSQRVRNTAVYTTVFPDSLFRTDLQDRKSVTVGINRLSSYN